MKIALIQEAPRRSRQNTITRYVDSLIGSIAAELNVPVPEVVTISALDAPVTTPTTPIGVLRAARPALMEKIAASEATHVITLGSNALKAVLDTVTLKNEHGRMRWVDICTDDVCTSVALTPAVLPYHAIYSSEGALHRDFDFVIRKVLSQPDGPLPPMDIDLHVVDSAEALRDALALLEGATVVGVDVETTGLAPVSDELLAVGIGAMYDATAGIAVVVPQALLKDSNVIDLIDDAVWRASRRSVGHNFKFDMQFIAPLIGWAPEGAKIGDTLLLNHLYDERSPGLNSRARGSGLKDLVAQRFDHQYGFDFAVFYAEGENADWEAMHKYLGEDVVYTARLWFDIVKDIEAEGSRVLETHDDLLMPVAQTIAKAEFAGTPVDAAWVQKTIDTLDLRVTRRARRLEAVIPRLAPTLVVDNVLSPQQVAGILIDEWGWKPDFRKHGKVVEDDRSTDKEHIQAMVDTAKKSGNPLERRRAVWAAQLLKLRADTKLKTTYQSSVLERINPLTGRIHASFLLHGTATGRISSRQPNLQNIPAVNRVDSEQALALRHAFRPGEGRVWVEVDYSQLELRVAAAISGDDAFAEVFRSGRDVHREIASSIFSKPPEDIGAAERFLAKAVSFGILYGRSAGALASGAEMEYAKHALGMKPWTEDQAEAFIRKFLRSYPRLEQWIMDTHQFVVDNHYVESPFGRRRRFLLVTDKFKNSVLRQSVNTPIQSAASDICLDAMVQIDRALEGIDATVLFPVHDSICLECDADQVDTLEEICRMVMEKPFMGVPLTVDYEWGPTWATVEKHPHA